MSIRAYRAALSELLESTSLPIASEVCFKLWDDYISNGIYLNPEYVKADITCAEGHLINPPTELPEEGIEILQNNRPTSFYDCDHLQRACLLQTEERLGKRLTTNEMLKHKKNALVLIRLFGRYNPYFGKRGVNA